MCYNLPVMKKPELVLPAGDIEKGRIALSYGADSIYLGLPEFSMRKTEVKFTALEISQLINEAHQEKKKVYITFNIFPHENSLSELRRSVKMVALYRPDAFIVSDLGVLEIIKKNAPGIPVHISTQTNVTNSESVRFWQRQGAKRIVLARELSLAEITKIHQKVPGMELEIFVHGAMCISYSGRCLLSSYMTGREANQGECAQPCRWEYRVVEGPESGVKSFKGKEDSRLKTNGTKLFLEEKLRPGEYFPIEENGLGTTIMNSKDLRLIRYLPKIIDSGISALKVEGRNKTEYYVATTARAYRTAIDYATQGKYNESIITELETELEKLNYRDYTTGFLFGKAKEGETYPERAPIRQWNFCGRVVELHKKNHIVIIKNQLVKDDSVEILTPEGIFKDRVGKIIVDGQESEKIDPGKKDQKAEILFSRAYPVSSMVRKKA